MEQRKKVMIVDDNVQVLEILNELLSDTYELKVHRSGSECIDNIDEFNPSLLILDIGLPDMSGYDVCEKLKFKSHFESLPILMLSGSTGPAARRKGYSSGAINYIEKPFDVGEFLQIIQATLRECKDNNQLEVEFGNVKVDLSAQVAFVDNVPLKLTRNEFRLLQALIHSPGQEFTRDELTKLLYTEKDAPNEDLTKIRSIDTHISSVRKKLVNSKIQIKSIYGKGYQLSLKD